MKSPTPLAPWNPFLMYRARIVTWRFGPRRCIAIANVLSAIWLQSSPLTAANNPNPEIDIQETFNYHGVVSTLHTWAIDPDTPAPTAADEYIHDPDSPE